MGADIYAYLEKHNSETNEWEPIGTKLWVGDGTINVPEDLDIWRSYALFSILAGVRSRGDIKPIVKPRGLPSDCSSEIRQILEDDDRYALSYLRLDEILNFDWGQTTTQRGVITFKQWVEWHEGERKSPSCYSYSVGGGGTATISEGQAEWLVGELGSAFIKQQLDKKFIGDSAGKLSVIGGVTDAGSVVDSIRKNPNLLNKLYVEAVWVESYRDAGYHNLTEAVEKMQSLSTSPTNDDVRMVFGFDS